MVKYLWLPLFASLVFKKPRIAKKKISCKCTGSSSYRNFIVIDIQLTGFIKSCATDIFCNTWICSNVGYIGEMINQLTNTQFISKEYWKWHCKLAWQYQLTSSCKGEKAKFLWEYLNYRARLSDQCFYYWPSCFIRNQFLQTEIEKNWILKYPQIKSLKGFPTSSTNDQSLLLSIFILYHTSN